MTKSIEYVPRFYREQMGNDRWISFHTQYYESDLWIAVDAESFCDEIPVYTRDRVFYYRQLLDNHIKEYPDFLSSLVPLEPVRQIHPFLAEMYSASSIAGTGPMAAVAGTMAEYICRDASKQFLLKEIIAENGGDNFMILKQQSTVSIYAGNSPLSDRIGLLIKPDETPLSVCCSSGTVGHSLSFGTADAVVIVCASGALADAYATACCNEVKNAGMIQNITEKYILKEDVLSVVIIKDEQVGIGGRMSITLL